MTLDLAQILERWKESKECPSSLLIQKLQECTDDVPALVARVRELEEHQQAKPLLSLEV